MGTSRPGGAPGPEGNQLFFIPDRPRTLRKKPPPLVDRAFVIGMRPPVPTLSTDVPFEATKPVDLAALRQRSRGSYSNDTSRPTSPPPDSTQELDHSLYTLYTPTAIWLPPTTPSNPSPRLWGSKKKARAA